MMQKNGQMIEMKGRCSMGQKVLASLIIRMALA
jgi:DNA repair exonuclease SbcCD ATPase subunit